MPARPFSLRVDDETVARLDERARAVGEPRSRVVQRYIEEGLRADAHPGIVFRGGPAGRRAALPGGPDVWEVIKGVKSFGGGEDGVAKAVEMAVPDAGSGARSGRVLRGLPGRDRRLDPPGGGGDRPGRRGLAASTTRDRVRLLLDEMFPAEIARQLRERWDCDAIAVTERAELRSLPDDELVRPRPGGRKGDRHGKHSRLPAAGRRVSARGRKPPRARLHDRAPLRAAGGRDARPPRVRPARARAGAARDRPH